MSAIAATPKGFQSSEMPPMKRLPLWDFDSPITNESLSGMEALKLMTIKIDHLTLNVKELQPSLDFYVNIMGFRYEKIGDPYTEIWASDDFMMNLAPFGGDRLPRSERSGTPALPLVPPPGAFRCCGEPARTSPEADRQQRGYRKLCVE